VGTLAIIDGDVLAYQACKPRWEKSSRVQGGVSQILLDPDGKRIPLEFTKEEDRKYLEESWENFKKLLRKLLDDVYCADYLMAVKGPDNFRNLMYPEYKMNRHADPDKHNAFVPSIRTLAVMEEYAIASDGREADDLIRIWAEQAKNAGDDYVICTIDKDLRCIPGKFWNMKHNRLDIISEEEAARHH